MVIDASSTITRKKHAKTLLKDKSMGRCKASLSRTGGESN